jgi:hypothetical protein
VTKCKNPKNAPWKIKCGTRDQKQETNAELN